MRVKIGDRWFSPETGQPIMVELNAADRRNIAAMHPEATRYPESDDDISVDDLKAWMTAETEA